MISIFSTGLRRLVGLILGTWVASGLASLLNTMVLMRYLGADLYGGYVYFGSIAALIPLLSGDLVYVLGRHVPAASTDREKVQILVGVSCVQSAIMATVVFAAALAFIAVPATRFWGAHMRIGGMSFASVALVVVLCVPVRLVGQWLSLYAAAMQRIGVAELLSGGANYLRLAILASVAWCVRDRQRGLELIAALELSLAIGVVMIWAWLHARWGNLWPQVRLLRMKDVPEIVRVTYTRYIRPYGMPLQLHGVANFVKSETPTLILGQAGLYGQAAVYHVIARVFKIVNHIIPDLFDRLLPRVIANMNRNRGLFERQFKLLCWGQLVFAIVCGWGLIGTQALWFGWFAIADAPDARDIVLLCASSLIVLSVAHPSIWEFRLGHTTFPVFVASATNAVITLAMMALMLPLDSRAMALISLVAATGSTLILMAYSARDAQTAWRTIPTRTVIAALSSPFLVWALARP